MTTNRETKTGLPRSLKVTGIVLLLGVVFLGGLAFLFFRQFDAWGPDGPYTINEIVLTDKLDENGYPIGYVDKFRPDQQIICWVSTKGAEGIIGMRWYYEDKLIFEHFDKTQDNQIYTFVQSSPTVTLPEGNYHVDIHITQTPRKTLYFKVERYKSEVIPAQPTPINHENKEDSPFVEVPFAFDEVWKISDKEWVINEVKVTFLEDDNIFVSIAVETDLDLSKLSQEQVFAITKPIGAYAIKNGYLEHGRSLQIDGKFYPLDKTIYVNLIDIKLEKGLAGKENRVYRVKLNIRDLLEPES
jgi:hypothetical protein